MSSDFWGRIVSEPSGQELMQGDIFDAEEFDLPIRFGAVVTQSCDLALHLRSVPGSKKEISRPLYPVGYVVQCHALDEWIPQAFGNKSFDNIVDSQRTQRIFRWNDDKLAYVPPFGEFSPGWILDCTRIYGVTLFSHPPDEEGLSLEGYDRLLENRICSLQPPWRERLGQMMGSMFHRIATDDATDELIKSAIAVVKPRPQGD